jgi:hypothetical protein
MKKRLLAAIFWTITTGGAGFAQAQQSISFTGPIEWMPGTQVTLSVDLTFAGYNAIALSYWLDLPNAIEPFLTITALTHFTFPNGYNGPFPIGIEAIDLGGESMAAVAPGSYHVTDLTIAVASNAPIGSYMLVTTSGLPQLSEVTDTNFNDHAIPPGPFAFDVVPEPGSLALFGIVSAGWGVLAVKSRAGRRRS